MTGKGRDEPLILFYFSFALAGSWAVLHNKGIGTSVIIYQSRTIGIKILKLARIGCENE